MGQRVLSLDIKSMIKERKIEKLNFIKLLNFHSMNGHLKTMKRQTTDQEKILVNHISNKRLKPKYIKNSQNSTV